jgi:WD40 repeat protein
VRAGLDPKFFEWPPAGDKSRAPYRGMRALEAGDAGIFFGREAPTIELMAELRGLRETPPPRLLVILGASGAGKSSFLRAGLMPRLAREDRHFVVLPVMRPGHDVLEGDDGLVRSLSQACNEAGLGLNRASVRGQVIDGDAEKPAVLAETLKCLSLQRRLPDLPGESARRDPTLVLAIDQAEELFLSEGAVSSVRFLKLIRALVTDENVPLMVLLTIRSDSYEHLQTAPALAAIQPRLYSLAPMPQGNYRMVIEGPVRRLNEAGRKLELHPAVTERLLADIQKGGGKDALPLLAFTLERLWADYGGDGDIRLDEYEAMGGICGAIDAVVNQMLQMCLKDPRLPRDEVELLALLRRGLIPWLAGIDPETQAPRRRAARICEIPPEARSIILHMVEQRLLSMDTNQEGETTVEPVHEALLRQWGLLKGWLQEDFATLMTLESVQRATRDWEANGRDVKWLVHQSGRLEDAETMKLRGDMATALTANDLAYLASCRESENERCNMELTRARELIKAQQHTAEKQHQLLEVQKKMLARTRLASGITAGLLIIVSVAGFHSYDVSTILSRSFHTVEFAVQLWDVATGSTRGNIIWHEDAQTGMPSRDRWGRPDVVALLNADGSRLVTASDYSVRLWDGHTGILLHVLYDVPQSEFSRTVESVHFTSDGQWVVVALDFRQERLWNAQSGAALDDGSKHGEAPAHFNFDGTLVITSDAEFAQVRDARTGVLIGRQMRHASQVERLHFSPDGRRVLTVSSDQIAQIWDSQTGIPLGRPMRHNIREVGDFPVKFSLDSTRLVTALDQSNARLWNVDSGAPIGDLIHIEPFAIIKFSPDSRRFIVLNYHDTQLWDAQTGLQVAGEPMCAADGIAEFDPSGAVLVIVCKNGSWRLWDAQRGAPIGEERWFDGDAYFSFAHFGPDGNLIVTNIGSAVQLWDARTGAAVRGPVDPCRHFPSRQSRLQCFVESARFSPDGRRLLTISRVSERLPLLQVLARSLRWPTG